MWSIALINPHYQTTYYCMGNVGRTYIPVDKLTGAKRVNTVPGTSLTIIYTGFNKFLSRWLENESRQLLWSEGPKGPEALWGSGGIVPWGILKFGVSLIHFPEIMTLRALLSKPFWPLHYKDILKNVQNVWRILLKIYWVIILNVWHLFYE